MSSTEIQESAVRPIYENAFVALEVPQAGAFEVVAGRTIEVPLKLCNIPESKAKLIFFTSDHTKPPGVFCSLKGRRLQIEATRPGSYTIKILIVDRMYPYLTGDPETDSPLEIKVKVV